MKSLVNKTYVLSPTSGVTCDGKTLEKINIDPTLQKDFCWGDISLGSAHLALSIMSKEFGPEVINHPIHFLDLMRDLIAILAPTTTHVITTKHIVECIRRTKYDQ